MDCDNTEPTCYRKREKRKSERAQGRDIADEEGIEYYLGMAASEPATISSVTGVGKNCYVIPRKCLGTAGD